MKNTKYIIVVSVLLICLIAAGAISFGYLNTKIVGEETAKSTKFLNIPLSISYSDNSESIKIPKNESFVPGSTFSKAFTLTNTGNEAFSFDVSLEDVVNTFNRKNDITYSVRKNGEIILNDIYPSESKTILTNQNINVDETITYEIIIKYNTSTENQIEDSGSTISARLYFDYSK